MEDTYFFVGQTVYSPIFGQGTIVGVSSVADEIVVSSSGVTYTFDIDGKLMPVTENSLQVIFATQEEMYGMFKYLMPEPQKEPAKATDVEVGGQHYKQFAIQPIEFITKNKIPFIEGNIIKYACRHRDKNGIEDLKKIKHYVDLLIQLEYNNGDE